MRIGIALLISTLLTLSCGMDFRDTFLAITIFNSILEMLTQFEKSIKRILLLNQNSTDDKLNQSTKEF